MQFNVKSKVVDDLVIVSMDEYNSMVPADLVITDMSELKKSQTLLDTTMFVYCEVDDISYFNEKLGYNIHVEQEVALGYDFVGLMINKNTGKIEKWYIEETTSKIDIENRLKEHLVLNQNPINNVNTRALTVVDAYEVNIAYTEATVNVNCILYKFDLLGAMDFVVNVVPANSYYGTKYIQPKITSSQGNVYQFSPQPTSGYQTSISISYPWGIGFTLNNAVSTKITKQSGGTNAKYIEWRYTPSNGTNRFTFYTQSGCTFNMSGASTPRCSVRYEIKLATINSSGETTRVVNYNTSF